MIGTRLEAPGGFPIAACAFLVATALCIALGAATSVIHWDIFAALPLAIAVALWLTRRRGFTGELTAEGLSVSPSGQLIRYDAMRAVEPAVGSPQAAGESYPIDVLHDNGAVQIPVRLNVSTRELATFLTDRIPLRPISISPRLEEYWQRQLGVYGADQVWAFAARDMPNARRLRRSTAVVTAGLIVSASWCALGFIAAAAAKGRRGQEEQWLAWGGTGVLSFLILLLIFIFTQSRRRNLLRGIKNIGAACLIISPQGLALTQGDMTGELQWREIRKVNIRKKQQLVRAYGEQPAGPGLHLDVGGATVWIADIYDQPLEVIAGRIRQYCQG
jgi:hypothetical protein